MFFNPDGKGSVRPRLVTSVHSLREILFMTLGVSRGGVLFVLVRKSCIR